jgi:DNA primase
MPSPTTEQVKEKLDIVQFMREYVQLTPAGKNFKGLCPFHREKTPSFSVSPERQTWHCFGCNLGGDIFSFLMRHENIEFGEALRILAEKAGVELRRLNPAEYKFAGLLHDINAAAKNFFIEQLKQSPVAEKYLAERGLKQETIAEFELGFAPNGQEALILRLLKQKFAPEDIVRAGLAIQTERGSRFDRFRGRIMFPIHDHFGKPVGFSGRIMPQFDDGKMGKYVNSPETPVFNKSKLLYGYHITKSHIRDAGWVFLVEGQMDLLMSYQAGVKNVAASSGTALTADHLRTLRRATDQLIIGFDSDDAGVEATERAIDLAAAADFGVKVARFGEYKDPADAAAAGLRLAEAGSVANAEAGADILQKAIAEAVPAPEFYFEKYLPSVALAQRGLPHQRDRKFITALRAVVGKLKMMASAVERDTWFKALAKRTGIEERVLLEEAERAEVKTPSVARPADGQDAVPETADRPVSRWDLLSEKLVAACMAKKDFVDLGEHAEYLTADYRLLYDLFRKGDRKAQDGRLDELMNLVMLRSEHLEDEEFSALKGYLHGEYVKARRRELIQRIKLAEAEGNDADEESARQEMKMLPVA